MPRPLYEQIVRDSLRISDAFLRKHSKDIRDRLNFAAAEMQRERGDIFAINQCVHLAGSIVLACASNNLNYSLDRVRQVDAFVGKDPSTVVTVAALYLLLTTELDGLDHQEEQNRQLLLQRFNELNWLVGPEGMAALNIERAFSSSHS